MKIFIIPKGSFFHESMDSLEGMGAIHGLKTAETLHKTCVSVKY